MSRNFRSPNKTLEERVLILETELDEWLNAERVETTTCWSPNGAEKIITTKKTLRFVADGKENI